MPEPIISPDGNSMWTGSEWTPIPPNNTQNSDEFVESKQRIEDLEEKPSIESNDQCIDCETINAKKPPTFVGNMKCNKCNAEVAEAQEIKINEKKVMFACEVCNELLENSDIECPQCRKFSSRGITFGEEENSVTHSSSIVRNFMSQKPRKMLIGIFGVILIISSAILFYPVETYTLEYKVTAISEEEFSLGYRFYDIFLDVEYGHILMLVEGCSTVYSCSWNHVQEFEYENSFMASFTIYVIGIEEVDSTICIEILVNRMSLTSSCYVYFDSDDEYNLGFITEEYFVNQYTLNKLE